MVASQTKPSSLDGTPQDQGIQEPQAAGKIEAPMSDHAKPARSISKTPEPTANQANEVDRVSSTPSSPDAPSPYDWDDFERRYEDALREADQDEREVLKEAENLSRVRPSWCTDPTLPS